jgi:uncharacterized membrane protein
MIEIIPNWHPIFVHFTVALCSTAVVFSLFAFLANYVNWIPNTLVVQFEIVGRWCLWTVAIITVGTVFAGLYAYNTVKHDSISHIMMTNHRNWALFTAFAIFLLACWSGWRYYQGKKITFTFILLLMIIQITLLSTAWRGGELVYRYGIGVMSLPQAEIKEHQHVPKIDIKNSPV